MKRISSVWLSLLLLLAVLPLFAAGAAQGNAVSLNADKSVARARSAGDVFDSFNSSSEGDVMYIKQIALE